MIPAIKFEDGTIQAGPEFSDAVAAQFWVDERLSLFAEEDGFKVDEWVLDAAEFSDPVEYVIALADSAYGKSLPDNLVGRAFSGEDVGDTLASFVAVELREVLEGNESMPEDEFFVTAIAAMMRAREDIGDVINILEDRRPRGPYVGRRA